MKKLLLIDTSERDKEIIKSILDVEFDVIVARNGTEGLSILDSMPSISVAVLVFPLIGLNGMETLQTIRSDSRFKHMAVVVVEKGKVSDEIMDLTVGADDVIHTPCDPELLLAKIRNVVTNRELLLTTQNRSGLQSNILDETDTAIYVVDAINYNLYYVNHAASKLMGCSLQNYSGKKCFKYLLGKNAPCEFCKVAIAHTKQNTSELYLPKADRTVKVTVRMMEWMGRPSYILYEDDITEQKKAYELAEKRYQQELQRRSRVNLDFMAYLLMNVTKGTVLEHDPHGFPVPTIAPGHPISDFIEHVLPTVIDFDKRREFAEMLSLENMRKAYEEGNNFLSIDYRRYSRQDNIIMWARSTIQLMKDPQSGELTAFLYTYDINEMRMIQETIQVAARYDYDILAHINLITETIKCYAQNKSRLNRFLNKEYPYEKTIQRYIGKYVLKEERAETLQMMQLSVISKELQDKDIYEVIVKIIERGQVRQKKVRFANFDKKYGMVFLSVVDITDVLEHEAKQRQNLVQELAAKNEESRRKTHFLSSVSEEMKNSLNTVIGMADIAEEDIRNDKLVRQSLQSIRKSTEHIVNIVNDMMDLSRIENGTMLFKKEFCDANIGLELLQKHIKPLLAAKNQKLVVEKQVYHTTYYADRAILQKMTANLIGFMSKATPSRGIIRTRLFELPSLNKNFVHFRFSLQSEQASVNETEIRNRMKAFAWLERGNGSIRNESGLELAIAKGLAAGYQGSLGVKCSPETGLEFVTDVHFELADKEAAKKKAVGLDARNNMELQGLQILVAEDKLVSILVARKLLASKGIKVDYVKNGKLAFQKFRDSQEGFYNLIILNLHLPEVDGYEAAQMIRACEHPQAKTIPIIAMSGNLLDDNEGKCLSAGMNAFIPKPIKGDRLLKLIVSVLQNA